MKLGEITTEKLRELPEQELGSLHRRVHMLAAQDQTDESLETLLERAHDLVVAEWVRRGNEHRTPLEFKKAFEADTPTLRFCNDVAGMLPFICGPRVLEVGFGDGRLCKMLAEAGFEVGGVEKAGNVSDVDGCETMEGDCANLPFEDGAYNTVLSKHVLEHLEDPAKGLAETCRVASDAVLHIVPLGARACADHRHDFDWESVNKLLDTVPHPSQIKRMGYGTVLLAVMRKGNFPGWLKDYGVIPLVPGYVSIVGSQLKSSEPGDCDVLIREYMTSPTIELAVRNRMKDSVRDKLHWVYAPGGPHGNSFTLFDLALVPRDLHRAFDDVEDVVKSVCKDFALMRRFQPPKPRHAEYLVGDGLDKLMKEYVEPILGQGGSVAVEEKLNGFRCVGMHDGKEALIFFEGDKRNRARQFPLLAAELSMAAPVAFDMEVGGIQKSGRPLPRKDLAWLSNPRNVVEREFGDGVSLVAHAFDCMWGGEDLTGKAWAERRKALEGRFGKADFKILKLVPTFVSKSAAEVRDRIQAVSERAGSEGAVVKDVEAKYPAKPEGASSVAYDGMSKIKNVAGYVAEVLGKKETKAGTYSYEIGIGGGIAKFDPNQERDEGGKWTSGVGSTPSRRTDSHENKILAWAENKFHDKRTAQAFSDWFEQSTVVDKSGNPIIVYHGTDEAFTTFAQEKTDLSSRGSSGALGFYFTENAQEAGHYARREGGNVIAAYLSIQNPATLSEEDHRLLTNSRADARKVRDKLIAAKHDGALTPLGEWVAFYPTQVKSAIGNRSSDGKNPDITKQGVEQVKQLAKYLAASDEAFACPACGCITTHIASAEDAHRQGVNVESIGDFICDGCGYFFNPLVFTRKETRLLSLGNAMNTGVKAEVGDHLSMTAEEVMPEYDEKAKAWGVSCAIQMVQGKTDEPVSSVEDLVREAVRRNVLQADDKTLARLKDAGLVKADVAKAEDGGKGRDGERGAGPEGRMDFVEGMKGAGVFQEHWIGLESREDAEAGRGGAGSVHTDFRMLPDGATSWEGGELFTPGVPGKRSKLLDYKSGEKIMMNFKVPHSGERPERGELPVVRGPREWMTIAAKRPAVLNPGEPGATSQKWARIEQVDTFRWEMGTADDHYKEFKFTFDKHPELSGRWIMMYAPLQQGRFWLLTRPAEQRMDSEREAKTKGADVVAFVRELAQAIGSGMAVEKLVEAWS